MLSDDSFLWSLKKQKKPNPRSRWKQSKWNCRYRINVTFEWCFVYSSLIVLMWPFSMNCIIGIRLLGEWCSLLCNKGINKSERLVSRQSTFTFISMPLMLMWRFLFWQWFHQFFYCCCCFYILQIRLHDRHASLVHHRFGSSPLHLSRWGSLLLDRGTWRCRSMDHHRFASPF